MKGYPWLIASILLFGCRKSNEVVQTADVCSVQITHQLRNPYTQPSATMRQSHPTHTYVKFYLYHASEYKALEAKGVFLLDHPFDALPDKELNYATEQNAQYGVYYGVVPYGVDVSAYRNEKLSELYMPEQQGNFTTGKQFSGKVSFFDPVDSAMVPLRGVKVIIRDATRTANAVTDSFGNFSINSASIVSDTVEVLLKFDNDYLEIHTLDFSNLSAVFGTNIYSMGFKKACGFNDMQIEIGNQFNNAALLHSCAALHALNEYTDFAHHFGLQMPVHKMLFWIAKDAVVSSSYATPMLHDMAAQNLGNPEQLLTNLFAIPASVAAPLSLLIKDQLPDMYAPFYSRYASIARAAFIETLFHELSHAAHYAKVGPDYWIPYVEYIVNHGGYGQASFANSGIISLSEAWAEDLSNICANYTYGYQKYLDWDENTSPYWIPYGLYYDLYDSGTNEAFDQVSGISFPMVYAQFTVDTNSPALLKAKLKTAYPAQAAAIDTLFAYYGF